VSRQSRRVCWGGAKEIYAVRFEWGVAVRWCQRAFHTGQPRSWVVTYATVDPISSRRQTAEQQSGAILAGTCGDGSSSSSFGEP